MTNRSTTGNLTVSPGITVTVGICIERSAEDVFDFWRDLVNLPRFMSYVEHIDSNGTSHWAIVGPAGATLEWDARLINEQRPRLISWKSVGNPDVLSEGTVKIRSLGAEATDVELRLQFNPTPEKLGAWLSTVTAHSPAKVLRDDLRHLKHLFESDEWRTTPGARGITLDEAWMSRSGV